MNAEEAWLASLARKPSAQTLLRFLAASEALTNHGCGRNAEPPAQQACTWRRIVCHAFKNSDTPFGMRSPEGKMPRVVALVNLSGHNAMYYCDNFSLARVLCGTCQMNDRRLCLGIEEVITAAEKGPQPCSVLVTFVQPFAATLDEVHWELRTIRKTAKGVVKDGEKAFSRSDACARETSCTSAIESWPSEMLEDLAKKLLNVSMPACLDTTQQADVAATPEKMQAAIAMLQAERKRVQEDHTAEKRQIEAAHERSLSAIEADLQRTRAEADSRVSEVLKHAEVARDTAAKKNAVLEEHNATLMQQLTSAKLLAAENSSRFNALALEHEQDLKKAKLREKALTAQISSIQVEKARSLEKERRDREVIHRGHEDELEAANEKLAGVQRELSEAKQALEEANADAKNAFKRTVAAERNLKAFSQHSETACARARVLLGLLKLAALRAREAKRDSEAAAQAQDEQAAAALRAQLAEANESIEQRDKRIEEAEAKIRSLEEDATSSSDTVVVDTKTDQSVDQKVDEQRKRIMLLEVENEKLKDARRGPPPPPPQTNVNVQNSTAVFMPSQQFHPHSAFPQGNVTFPVDPALEAVISQLHAVLSTVTSTARASSGHRKALEAAEAKLQVWETWSYGATGQYVNY